MAFNSFTNVRRHLAWIRLFPVVALLAVGSAQAAESVIGSSTSYITRTLFSSGPGDRWTMGASESNAHFSTSALGIRWKLHLSYRYPTGDLRFGLPEHWSPGKTDTALGNQFRGRVVPFARTTNSQLSAGLWHERLQFELYHRYRADNRAGYGIGIRARPVEFLEVGFRRSLVHPEPAASELYYEFHDASRSGLVGGSINWSVPTWLTEADVSVIPAPGLHVRSTFSYADMTPATPQMTGAPSGDYLITLSGTAYYGTVGIEYIPAARWRVWAGVRHFRLACRLMGYDGGERFAHFGVVQADVTCRSLGVQFRRCQLSVEFGSGDGALMGSVEVWPFDDGLVRLLGERRQIIAEGMIDWRQVTLLGSAVRGRRFSLELAATGLRVRPEITWKSWRPAAFGFAVDDLKCERLDLIRADLVQLRIMPAIRAGVLVLKFDVSQWLPATIRKLDRTSTPNSTGSESSEIGSSGRKTWGGFSASVRLSLGL